MHWGALCFTQVSGLTKVFTESHQHLRAEPCCGVLCASMRVYCLQGMSGRAPPDPIEMSRLEQQAEAFEEALQQDPQDLQVG
jgi:hypothetical protein